MDGHYLANLPIACHAVQALHLWLLERALCISGVSTLPHLHLHLEAQMSNLLIGVAFENKVDAPFEMFWHAKC